MAADWKIVNAGVDWVTCTGNTEQSRKRVFNLGMRLMDQELKRGNERRVWSFEGYKGFKAGGIQVGARESGSVLRITGGLADEHFNKAYDVCDNVSRLDLQFTARVDRAPAKVIACEYRRALKHSRSLKRGPTVDIWKSSNGSATCYLGQRVSERCARIYDKGRQSLLPVLDGCVRYELELKGAAAKLFSAHLANSRSRRRFAVDQVLQFVEIRGCRPELTGANLQTIVLHRPAADCARQLQWLRDGVRPTVQRLIAAGLEDAVLNCLGLETRKGAHLRVVKRA